MTVREALVVKVRTLQERRARLQADLAAVTAELQDAQATAAAMTPGDDTTAAAWVRLGILRVSE